MHSSSQTTTSRHSITPRALVARLRRRCSNADIVPALRTQPESPSLPDEEFYPIPINHIREIEYPHLKEGVYLDHSGTTIYARSLIDDFAKRMSSNLYGNPHSANRPASRSGHVVDRVREEALRFLGADPAHFDLVFVANATAGIKLVADSFRDLAEQTRSGSFWYGYHKDSHTSLVGVRELTHGHSHCFESDAEVAGWLDEPEQLLHVQGHKGDQEQFPRQNGLALFAYPGQSNMSGRRLPLSWPGQIRASPALQNTYTLLDCAALAMTSSLHKVFRDPDAAPDFTCVSLYKVFGFPDLGALIVRKDSGHILTLRKYFGGGTVTMVSVLGGQWHKLKGRDTTDPRMPDMRRDTLGKHGSGYNIHDGLEDGTLPFHNILALGEAIRVHLRLYGSMDNISRHTMTLSTVLYQKLRLLSHSNGRPLCRIYTDEDGMDFSDHAKQGPTVAFNLFDSQGYHIPYSHVENASNDQNIYLRSGGLCCPGGLFTALEYEPWQLQRALSAHHTCGPDGLSIIQQLPTGLVRASLGAMSSRGDIDALVSFLQRTFVDKRLDRAKTLVSKQIEADRESEATLFSLA